MNVGLFSEMNGALLWYTLANLDLFRCSSQKVEPRGGSQKHDELAKHREMNPIVGGSIMGFQQKQDLKSHRTSMFRKALCQMYWNSSRWVNCFRSSRSPFRIALMKLRSNSHLFRQWPTTSRLRTQSPPLKNACARWPQNGGAHRQQLGMLGQGQAPQGALSDHGPGFGTLRGIFEVNQGALQSGYPFQQLQFQTAQQPYPATAPFAPMARPAVGHFPQPQGQVSRRRA